MLVFKGILIIILSFAFGVTFTLFCLQIRKNPGNSEEIQRKKEENGCGD